MKPVDLAYIEKRIAACERSRECDPPELAACFYADDAEDMVAEIRLLRDWQRRACEAIAIDNKDLADLGIPISESRVALLREAAAQRAGGEG